MIQPRSVNRDMKLYSIQLTPAPKKAESFGFAPRTRRNTRKPQKISRTQSAYVRSSGVAVYKTGYKSANEKLGRIFLAEERGHEDIVPVLVCHCVRVELLVDSDKPAKPQPDSTPSTKPRAICSPHDAVCWRRNSS